LGKRLPNFETLVTASVINAQAAVKHEIAFTAARKTISQVSRRFTPRETSFSLRKKQTEQKTIDESINIIPTKQQSTIHGKKRKNWMIVVSDVEKRVCNNAFSHCRRVL
jgi:hypothetical protein